MKKKDQKYAIIILHSLLTERSQNLHISDIEIARNFLNHIEMKIVDTKKEAEG